MSALRDALLVGIGGMLGSIARHLAGTLAITLAPTARLAPGTLLVNVVGCLAIGLLLGATDARPWLSPERRLFLVTGLLGGFTTYSAFAAETVRLAGTRAGALAVANVVLHLVLGLGAVWLGSRAGGVLVR